MLKLLIIDDEEIILKGLQRMVKTAQTPFTEVVGVSDAFEALQLMDTFCPDLVLTDIQMPEMNGLELIRNAASKEVGHFVIITGYDDFEYARQALRLQIDDYLLKPVDQKELSTLLLRISAQIMEEKLRTPVEVEDMVGPEEGNLSENDPQSSIGMFEQFIRNNYVRDLSLEEVAEHLQLHPNYLCTLLKRKTGLTFVHYLRMVRIEKAKLLMRGNPNISMEQISHSVGYENARHFYKVFKQYVGQTPGSYRETVTSQASRSIK